MSSRKRRAGKGAKGGERRVYLIGAGAALAPGASPEEMGFKAYNLARMAAVGLPVPPAFVLGTGFCRGILGKATDAEPGLRELLAANVRRIEDSSGLAFGGTRRPLRKRTPVPSTCGVTSR